MSNIIIRTPKEDWTVSKIAGSNFNLVEFAMEYEYEIYVPTKTLLAELKLKHGYDKIFLIKDMKK